MAKINLEDLIGIPLIKRKKSLSILNDLLKFRDDTGELFPIITGYNGYTQIPSSNRAVTFSHIHETETYRRAMFLDLEKMGYSEEQIVNYIRQKLGVFLWELKFLIKDEQGPYPDLVIKFIETNDIFDTASYSEETLENHPELEGKLYSENYGWELDFPFNNKKELIQLVNLFTKKAYKKN